MNAELRANEVGILRAAMRTARFVLVVVCGLMAGGSLLAQDAGLGFRRAEHLKRRD